MKKKLPWIFAGAGLMAMAVVLVVTLRGRGEPLTLESLEAAEKRWTARDIHHYDLQVKVSGVQQGLHDIQVRGGRVVRMTTGGAEVPESVWSYWSIPGMFRFLRTELQMKDVVLLVEFDAGNGIPRHFLRHFRGTMSDIRWEVTSFEIK